MQPARPVPSFPAGTPSPIQGAPPLPSVTINVKDYPALDKVPPTDSEMVKDWLKKIDLTKAPAIKPTGKDGCDNTTFNADQIAKAGPTGNCWWTCGGCTREGDVAFCPNKGTWGASFDDGPSESTPALLDYLDQENLKATFFVVGSRAISHPEILQAEYMTSHQICIHTWSHSSLTTLTNEQIVSELAWTMKALKDILGVTPTCVRPPYGDYDDRTRYIFKEMGLTAYVWTIGSAGPFDSNDWKVVSGSATPSESVNAFQKILTTQTALPSGFIVLAHDIYEKSVALSINAFLPSALKTAGMKVQSIATCLGLSPGQTYFETSKLPTPDPPAPETTESNKNSGHDSTRNTPPPPKNQNNENGNFEKNTSTSNTPYTGPYTTGWKMSLIFTNLFIAMLLSSQHFGI
ncbi:hypothetical protein CROQUDRAFT_59100 [Cronartium quercuum f. sp. fusiforme G11]|uniref:chitin deacetylase n=1 Tax=Cronartium quercuum f. sp. fusiforme G11 TaxID=708437 RepID=A0A9P6NU38_9BASI|nr:hypothetical protein CROQUDRAFT_59100 [Cronartium quercuum f. sp. fusiforme G11]